jgi:CelD/BcsL family acetyltransferase involved in cellulose biosynthesis
VNAELVALGAVDDEFIRAWERLAAEAIFPNPFFEPPLALAARDHLEGGHEMHALVVRDGERLRFLLPVVKGSWSRLKIPALRTFRHPYVFVGTPLIAVDTDVDAITVFKTLFAFAAQQPGVVVFEWTNELIASSVEMFAGSPASIRNRFVRPFLLKEDAALGALGRKERQTMERRRRKLERELGPTTTVDVAAQPEAIERFLELEHAGWKGDGGTSLLSSPSDAAFFRALCASATPAQQLSMWEMRDRTGRAVAMTTRLRSGEWEFDFKRTYAEDLGGYSPGRMLEIELLGTVDQRGHRAVDTCLDPPDPFYGRLTDAHLGYSDVVIAGRGSVARAAVRLVGRRHHRRVSTARLDALVLFVLPAAGVLQRLAS